MMYKYINFGENASMEVEMLETTETKQTAGEKCVICEHTKALGIHLYTSFICKECEREMIDSKTNDAKYKYYLKQLKKITNPEIYS